MLRRAFMGVLWVIPGYAAGAIGGGYLVYALSTNQHDRELEGAMTGAFVTGPLVAIVGFIAGAALGSWRCSTSL